MAHEAIHRQARRRHRLAWVVAFLIFFPILWTFITSFKSEIDAIAMPPKFLFFNWTLENYAEVQERSNYLKFAYNSIVLSIGANVFGLLIAVPAAWSMAFAPGKRTKDLLMWMLSTKMMPAVGVLVPIYLLFRRSASARQPVGRRRRADAHQSAAADLDALHLLQGNPGRHPRSRAHGRGLAPQRNPLRADADGGSGHRFDHAARRHPVVERSVLDAQSDDLQRGSADRPSSPPTRRRKGFFWAKLSAASTLAIAPILILGWFSQKQLVRGLTFGAVK